MRILVTGVNGQVGGELMDLGIADCELVPANRATLELADVASIESAFTKILPDMVVNCAAYTAVDQAEDEPEVAFAVNAEGPRHLARLCAAKKVPLIHVSTDAVFDGAKTELYLPSDSVNPLSVYGASKEAGERAIREVCPSHVILRTSWVFSARGKNFLKTMLWLGETGEHLRVVVDQTGSPTSAHDLAQAIAAVVTKISSGGVHWGTYHFCNRDVVSWYNFATIIFAIVEKTLGIKPEVEPIPTTEYPLKAVRPVNCALSTETFETEFEFRPRSMRLALEDILQEILTTKGSA